MQLPPWIDTLKYNNGLIPVVTQDATTKQVLMLAWANRQAIEASFETGFMHYYSRSRNTLWKKGETSGHVQKMILLQVDCDADTLLATVEQTGPACHRNTTTCFDIIS